jgi:PadR family transcriptional regulator, regulatory protein PadR
MSANAKAPAGPRQSSTSDGGSTRAIDEAKKGSAEIVILALIEHRSRHGYEIAGLIDERSGGTIRFTLASLYATLYRMEERGWIKGRWVEKPGQRRRCYYRITDAGRKMLAGQRRDWRRFVEALGDLAGVKYA